MVMAKDYGMIALSDFFAWDTVKYLTVDECVVTFKVIKYFLNLRRYSTNARIVYALLD